jgi:hypothetical protein
MMAVSASPYYYTFPTESFNGVDMPHYCGLHIYPSPPTNNCIGSDEMLEMLIATVILEIIIMRTLGC